MVDGVLNTFSEKEGSELVGASFTLKLTRRLALVPLMDVLIPDVCVERFGCDRAGRNCPVGAIRSSILPMPFKKDARIDGIDFINNSIVDVIDEDGEQQVEMIPARWTSIDVVIGSEAKQVVNIWFQVHKEIKGVCFR